MAAPAHRRVAFDTETHLIKPGMNAPKLACLSWCAAIGAGLLGPADGVAWAREQLSDPEVVLVGANTPYDLGVLCAEDPSLVPLVFRAYDDDRVWCVQTAQKLVDVANGELDFRRRPGMPPTKSSVSLAELSRWWLGEHLEKVDTWRLRYALLDGVAISRWPEEARAYAKGDASTTFRVDAAQQAWCAEAFESEAGKRDGALPDGPPQMRAAWALHLMATWGVRTDGAAVRDLRARLEAEVASGTKELVAAGLMRADGSRDMSAVKARVVAAYGGEAPKETKGGAVSTDKEVLSESGDEALELLGHVVHAQKLLGTYVPALERGVDVPITSRPNVLVASGRTSWGDPNLQNPPREDGVRECVVPRPGNVLVACDYDTLELRCFAQACLDLVHSSRMAEALREGRDLHLSVAAQLLGTTYEDAVARRNEKEVADARQLSKCLNFGAPGGMGAEKFVSYVKANGKGVRIDLARARELIWEWKGAWPEVAAFFDLVSDQVGQDRRGVVVQLRSGRVRGGCGFCDGANTYFQGLAADGAKRALWAVARECYADPSSALHGSRPIMFLHDELILESPEHRASAAAERLRELMIREMSALVTDVPIEASPAITRRWLKGAKPVRVDGQLVAARPVKEGKETRWVADLAA